MRGSKNDIICRKRFFSVLTVLCVISAAHFGVMFWRTQREYRRGEEDLALISGVRGESPDFLTGEQREAMDEASRRAAEVQEHREKLEGYLRLREENSDVIGWIRIDGTPIDYPVMQTPEEPDYYLRRGFGRKYSVYGMIYMDAACRADGACFNYILYGHHMKNGSMFASLEKYASEDYYREYPYLQFDLLRAEESGESGGFDGEADYESGAYEIVAAFKLPASQMNTDFACKLAAATPEDYGRLIEYGREHSFYNTGVTAVWPEQLVTLTTCEYTQRDGRFFVIAKERKGGEDRRR